MACSRRRGDRIATICCSSISYMNTAIEQIAAAARAGARSERCFEEFGRKLGDLMQCLAALFLRLRLARHHRQWNPGLLRQPLDRFRKAHAFGEHEKIENVAVLAGGKVASITI